MRFENWKLVYEEQRAPGTLLVWAEPFTKLRLAKFYDLHSDPFERADVTSNTYWDWLIDHAYIQYGAVAEIAQYLETYKEYPPSQRPASFSVEGLVECRTYRRPWDPLIPHTERRDCAGRSSTLPARRTSLETPGRRRAAPDRSQ
jgi:hypothetical protein